MDKRLLYRCHKGPIGGYHEANFTAKRVSDVGFYWPSIYRDAHDYVKKCDGCQRTCNISLLNSCSMGDPGRYTNVALDDPGGLVVEHMSLGQPGPASQRRFKWTERAGR